MGKSGVTFIAWFFKLIYVCLVLNNYVGPNLGDGTKSLLMIACFTVNDISPLLFSFFWKPAYYQLNATEQYFPGKSKEMRARWSGVLNNI